MNQQATSITDQLEVARERLANWKEGDHGEDDLHVFDAACFLFDAIELRDARGAKYRDAREAVDHQCFEVANVFHGGDVDPDSRLAELIAVIALHAFNTGALTAAVAMGAKNDDHLRDFVSELRWLPELNATDALDMHAVEKQHEIPRTSEDF